MNKYLLAFLVISFVSVFFLGTYVGIYKIFPYGVLDSIKDDLLEQKTIESNQFINQANVDYLIKIDSKSDIDQKRDFLTEFFWDVESSQHVKDKSQLP